MRSNKLAFSGLALRVPRGCPSAYVASLAIDEVHGSWMALKRLGNKARGGNEGRCDVDGNTTAGLVLVSKYTSVGENSKLSL
jgi:hypothetical protein